MKHAGDQDQSPHTTPPVRPDPRALALALIQALGADAVLTGAACARYLVQGHVPAVVALPSDADAVGAALAASASLGAAVVPWGGGTRQELGYPPERCDVVLSLERLRRVLVHDPADLTLTVEAGTNHAALAEALAAAGQMLPLDVPFPARATLGGTLATATPGPRRALYGGPRDLVLGLRVVDADGALLKTGGRVVKNVTGYDMSKLYVGSLGTLGVIVEASVKLLPRPEDEATIVGIHATPPEALAGAEHLRGLAVSPSALVVFSASATSPLASSAPEQRGDISLAVRYSGPAAAVARARREAEDALRARGARDIRVLAGATHEAFWAAALEGMAALERPMPDEALLRVSALPAELAEVLDRARALAAKRALALAWMADAATGTVWLRARRRTELPAEGDDFGAALGALHAGLDAGGRGATVLSCALEYKAGFALWGREPASLGMMREIKRRFDPARRLNPGRYIGRI